MVPRCPFYFAFILAFFFEICFKTSRVFITLYALNLGAKPFTVGALAAIFICHANIAFVACG